MTHYVEIGLVGDHDLVPGYAWKIKVTTGDEHCILVFEPVHEISNNVVCATSKASDQPAHTRSLIRAFARRFLFYDC